MICNNIYKMNKVIRMIKLSQVIHNFNKKQINLKSYKNNNIRKFIYYKKY